MGKRYRLEWSEPAVADVDAVLHHVASREGDAEPAIRLHEKLMAEIETLTTTPQRCRIVPELRRVGVEEYRELIVNPYRVCFRIRGRVVVIVGVLDGRRDLDELLVERALSL